MAEHFAVTGGARLVGSVDVVGAKNSVLKLMAAALLAEGKTTLTNCPEILDVPLMADVLRSLGCGVTVERDVVVIDVPAELGAEADYRSVSKLRASVCGATSRAPLYVISASGDLPVDHVAFREPETRVSVVTTVAGARRLGRTLPPQPVALPRVQAPGALAPPPPPQPASKTAASSSQAL